MLVAGEELVGALPGQHDFDVAARELGDEKRRDRGEVGDRLVERVHRAREEVLDVHRLDDERVMIGAEMTRHAFGVRALVVAAGDLEADRKRLDGLREHLAHQPDDDARVDAAAQKGAERHVAEEPPLHRVTQKRA